MNRLFCLTTAAALFAEVPPELAKPSYRISEITGIGHDPNHERQDPGNVIRDGDTYYVWYTFRVKGLHPHASTIFWASSKDGRNWTEHGLALGKGPKGSWDSFGVITPYTAIANGKYYLFYTATSDNAPFEANKTLRHIGVAVANHVRGPWKKLPQPVISPAGNESDWDSLVVDDACVIIRDGKLWLYYKGRNAKVSGRQTQWGLAIAAKPEGPYRRHAGNPVLNSGHTVNIWPHREGVAALVDNAGPQRYSVQWSPDGIHFEMAAKLDFVHTGTAAYSPDAFSDTRYGQGISWGVAQHRDERSLRLVRFDCDMLAPGR